MVFHLGLYDATVQANGLTQLNAKSDNSGPLQIQSNGFIVTSALQYILGMVGIGTSALQDAELRAPSFKKRYGYQSLKIRGLRPAALWNVTADHGLVDWMPDMPLQAESGEELDCYVDNANTSELARVFIWLGDAPISPITSPSFTTRWTSTTAAVAETWTPVTLVPDESIPSGRFGVVGLKHESATGLATRLTFEGTPFRPGVLSDGVAGLGAQANGTMSDAFRHGAGGLLGSFTNRTAFGAEVLCTGTDNSHRFLVDLVQLA